ncbi:polyprenyl synthetase family protein [Paenibacillus sacheonensis]|uniref:Heptaprenyl diphosphate synthase n=1 Tax=Paenibacillus sacheonensis TaxID=742054 RepID=A0A7X4YMD7_9BACL|nr:polyprenyl synthetase family protein [Paenibacillus sacheonensis]MBM7564490.1 heptaprenyl diphosphate synthase [Paenibacillus sacheonensis]NBC69050.1 heptaprenyl diphosphate synthase [Paenibacillus sacheonensis]
MKLLDIYAKMKSDLDAIEGQLARSVTTDHALLSDASTHLLKAGGKRIRPVFVLLSGKFGTYDLSVLQLVAVPLELIHMASLVHDDVIDNAETRRGQLTVKSKWDNRIAMYTGDYIYGKALAMVTELENPEIHQILAKAMVQMCIGEMEQIRDFFNTKQTVRNYLLRIRRKTALLIAVSCQLGAIAGGADRKTANRLYRFGYNVGMAFQIRDDLLDLLGTEKQIGKPPGSDIRQGNITLPVLLALRETASAVELQEHIQQIQASNGAGDTKRALNIIRKSAGIGIAEEMATRYIDKAIAALGDLPNIPAKKNLTDIAHFIAKRNY